MPNSGTYVQNLSIYRQTVSNIRDTFSRQDNFIAYLKIAFHRSVRSETADN